ncbi:hypothetical protein [Kytococcus sedentarius]|uniref:hypothetical protein n=1 Tax=Kytococcus sedentarius TaxID=1276 RepID=UPI0035BC67EE
MTISRRKLVQGAAWTAPAIAVATAAPALAASPGTPIVIDEEAEGSCKFPGESRGQKAYRIAVHFTNESQVTGTVTIDDIAGPDGKELEWAGDQNQDSYTIPPGGDDVVFFLLSDDSANISVQVTYSVTVDGNVYTLTETVTIPEFPPCEKDIWSPWE